MTCLYDPQVRSENGCFKLTSEDTEVEEHGVARRARKSRKTRQTLDHSDSEEYARQTLIYLLPALKLTIPWGRKQSSTQAPPSLRQSVTFYADAIVASNINYYVLSRVGHVTIRWTRSICEHLDFDEHGKALSLFAYPAFCAYACCSGATRSLFDR